MLCRICSSASLRPFWPDGAGHQWHRCTACGSDSCDREYPAELYGAGYIDHLLAGEGATVGAAPTIETAIRNHWLTLAIADRWLPGKPGRTFLDVGTGTGASCAVMRRAGWGCVGFDVTAEDRPEGTVLAPRFQAGLFARPFDVVQAREVLEHVPDPFAFLRELRRATAGLLILSTPSPLAEPAEIVYAGRAGHLTIWHPDALERRVRKIGFRVLERIVHPVPYSPVLALAPA